jgi:DNA (cytosine-5)-methyltransferase 1
MTFSVISLFTGIGGLDFGFEAAGFDTTVAVDLDRDACSSIRTNRQWSVLEGPIAEFGSSELLHTAGLAKGEADVLIGGPPCQPFSKSGYWATGSSSRLDDPRSDTLSQYLRILGDTLPRTFLIENVPGLAFKGKSEAVDAITRGIDDVNRLNGTNYSVNSRILNAADFGVPQLRERIFFVGSRDGSDFRFPKPTHGSAESGQPPLRPHTAAWHAIHELSDDDISVDLKVTGKWADLLPSIPEGQNYLWHTERGGGAPLFGWRRRYWNFLLKLAKDRPAWTIQAQPGPATGPFHWTNRKLSPLELGRLQTFPDGMSLPAKHADAQRLIGNAVPSALSEALARAIATQFLGAKGPRELPSLLPSETVSVPAPSRIGDVPRKYLSLLRSDTPHPGTGRGRSAESRPSERATE